MRALEKLKTPRGISLSLATLFIIATGVFIGYQYAKYRQFRAEPRWHVFESEITNAGPASPIARYMIFRNGSASYNKELLRWLSKMELNGAYFDTHNMNDFLFELDKRQLIHLTGTFSTTPEPLVPHIKKKLFSTAKGCFFKDLDDENAWTFSGDDIDEEYDGYSEEEEPEPEESNTGGFEVTHIDPLTEAYLDEEEVRDSNLIPWRISFESIADENLRFRIEKCIRDLSPEESKFFPMPLVPKQGRVAERLLDQLIDKENAILIANISTSTSVTSKRARKWLVDNVSRIPDSQLAHIHQNIISSDVRNALFNRWIREGNEDRAIATVRQTLLAGDDAAAERMAKRVVDGPDSSLKKDLIVILARNHTSLGRARIDEAFTGKHPRRELFYSYENYFRSAAMDQYSRLSGHGYLEVGKEFPAIYCILPSTDEEQELRRFIGKYPWFPATDDAHLRLASRLFLDGNLDAAKLELDRLEAANYVDADARELVPKARELIRKARLETYSAPSAEDWYVQNLEEKCWSAKREAP